MMGRLGVSSKKQQETYPIACFWGSHGSLTIHRVIIAMTDHVTCGALSCEPLSCT